MAHVKGGHTALWSYWLNIIALSDCLKWLYDKLSESHCAGHLKVMFFYLFSKKLGINVEY